jgi:hypothetical protein
MVDAHQLFPKYVGELALEVNGGDPPYDVASRDAEQRGRDKEVQGVPAALELQRMDYQSYNDRGRGKNEYRHVRHDQAYPSHNSAPAAAGENDLLPGFTARHDGTAAGVLASLTTNEYIAPGRPPQLADESRAFSLTVQGDVGVESPQ